MFVDPRELLDRQRAVQCFVAADENTIWRQQIIDRRAFSEKFRIGQNLIGNAGLLVSLQNGLDRFCGFDGHGGFFHDDLITG